jgi:hypothetical protein
LLATTNVVYESVKRCDVSSAALAFDGAARDSGSA